jgi:hypothetical protein
MGPEALFPLVLANRPYGATVLAREPTAMRCTDMTRPRLYKLMVH